MTVDGVDPSAVTWSVSDDNFARIESVEGGAMLTTLRPGDVTVIADVQGVLCGSAPLKITPFNPVHWQIGAERYTTGVALESRLDLTQTARSNQPVEAACTSCHGASAVSGTLQTVAHTPTQTAGFSDDELINIFTAGTLPEDAYIDISVVERDEWERFHRWSMTPEQQVSMVAYLRALTPSAQTGQRGFNLPSRPPGDQLPRTPEEIIAAREMDIAARMMDAGVEAEDGGVPGLMPD